MSRPWSVLPLIALWACAPAAGDDTAARNTELARSGYEAFARGDVAAVVALLDPAVVWHEAETLPYGGVFHGPDAVVENVFARLGGDWDPFAAIPRQYIAVDSHVVVLGEYRGTSRATGRSFTAPLAHVFTFRNRLVVEFRQFTDPGLWLRAMTP
jgi:ketosteroid isomerase-like protein